MCIPMCFYRIVHDLKLFLLAFLIYEGVLFDVVTIQNKGSRWWRSDSNLKRAFGHSQNFEENAQTLQDKHLQTRNHSEVILTEVLH